MRKLRGRNIEVTSNPRFRRKSPSDFVKNDIKIIEVKQPHSKVMKEGLALYSEAFPDRDEREPLYMIRERVRDYQSGQYVNDEGDRFHVLAAVDKRTGRVVGYTQWSTLAYEANVGYFEYICVDPDYRRRGIFTELEAARSTISQNDLRANGSDLRGSIREAEFIGQGNDEDAREFTRTRLEIHQRNGERAVLLEGGDGSLIPFWMQPPLTASSDPIMLHLLFQEAKPVERNPENRGEMPKETLRAIISGMMSYFTDGYFDSIMVDAKKVAALTGDRIRQSIDGVTLSTRLMMRKIKDAKRVVLVPPTTTETIDAYAQRCSNLAQLLREK